MKTIPIIARDLKRGHVISVTENGRHCRFRVTDISKTKGRLPRLVSWTFIDCRVDDMTPDALNPCKAVHLREDETVQVETESKPVLEVATWADAIPTEPGLYLVKPGDDSTPEYDVARVNADCTKALLIHWDHNLDLAAVAGKGHRWLGPLPEAP